MKKILMNAKISLGFIAMLWAIHLADFILPIDLNQFGIHPRTVQGLVGIFFAPFLHGNWLHLAANTVALLILLFIALTYDDNLAIPALIIITVVAGLGTWLFGLPGSVHIGASSIIFGLVGYMIFLGWYKRKIKELIFSGIVAIFYGWTLSALLVVLPNISWSGHFFGFIGGIIAAKFAATQNK